MLTPALSRNMVMESRALSIVNLLSLKGNPLLRLVALPMICLGVAPYIEDMKLRE